jgi:hypothetical protein
MPNPCSRAVEKTTVTIALLTEVGVSLVSCATPEIASQLAIYSAVVYTERSFVEVLGTAVGPTSAAQKNGKLTSVNGTSGCWAFTVWSLSRALSERIFTTNAGADSTCRSGAPRGTIVNRSPIQSIRVCARKTQDKNDRAAERVGCQTGCEPVFR